jgi:hypothetical protein
MTDITTLIDHEYINDHWTTIAEKQPENDGSGDALNSNG